MLSLESLSFSWIGFEQFFACKPHKASTTAASFILANLVITLYSFQESIQTDAIPIGLQKITCRIALDDFCSPVISTCHILAPSVNVDICGWWRQVVEAISLQTAVMIVLHLALDACGLACPTLTEFI